MAQHLCSTHLVIAALGGVALFALAFQAPPNERAAPAPEGAAKIEGAAQPPAAPSEGAPSTGGRARARCRQGLIPDFPTPLPMPSARMALPTRLLADLGPAKDPRLDDVAAAFDKLLLPAGYSERAYFRLRRDDQTVGFALATRMERIKRNGAPYPGEKRFLSAGASDEFNVLGFLKSLFVAPVGYYRVLVFTVSREPIATNGEAATEATTNEWLAKGARRLRGCVAQIPFTQDFNIDALVYEFRHAPESEAQDPKARVSQMTPSKLDPALHLKQAGILQAP